MMGKNPIEEESFRLNAYGANFRRLKYRLNLVREHFGSLAV